MPRSRRPTPPRPPGPDHDGERMPMVDNWPNSPASCCSLGGAGRGAAGPGKGASTDRSRKSGPPLPTPDPDLLLGLRPLIGTIYKRSRFAQRIDDTKPIDPPLPPETATWLTRRLRKKP
jgi:hypothetical protein